MGKALILFSATLLMVTNSFAQDSTSLKITNMKVGGNYNFQIVGEESIPFIDSLFSQYPDTKRKGYIWKFKNVAIPGLDNPVTLQVHQGLHGEDVNSANDSTKCGKSSYFTTFTSEKYKQQRLGNKKQTEQDAILIYVKKRRKFAVSNSEDAKLIKAYLLSLYNS